MPDYFEHFRALAPFLGISASLIGLDTPVIHVAEGNRVTKTRTATGMCEPRAAIDTPSVMIV